MLENHKIILVPFPYDDFSKFKVRPALCLSEEISQYGHIIVSFISSQIPVILNSTDIVITKTNNEFEQTGLKHDSIIILHKLNTISRDIIISELGYLPSSFNDTINENLKSIFKIK